LQVLRQIDGRHPPAADLAFDLIALGERDLEVGEQTAHTVRRVRAMKDTTPSYGPGRGGARRGGPRRRAPLQPMVLPGYRRSHACRPDRGVTHSLLRRAGTCAGRAVLLLAAARDLLVRPGSAVGPA